MEEWENIYIKPINGHAIDALYVYIVRARMQDIHNTAQGCRIYIIITKKCCSIGLSTEKVLDNDEDNLPLSVESDDE